MVGDVTSRVSSRLLGTPWSVRFPWTSSGHCDVEIYEDGSLLDVVGAAAPAPNGLLRNARRGIRAEQPCAIAWGRSPIDPDGLAASFTWGRPRAVALPADVLVCGLVWLALADGPFNGVTVTHRGSTVARRWIRGTLPAASRRCLL
jgi:hypothetical protein